MNFDDLVDDRGATPQEAPAQQSAPQLNFDELQDDREAQAGPGAQAQAPQDERTDVPSSEGQQFSPAGSFAAGAAKGAVPTTGGLAAGLYAGSALTAATANPLVGVLGGLAVGMGAGSLLDYGQDKLLALMGWDKPLNEAEQQNPTSFQIGQMAPAAALLRPTGTMLQRGVGAAIGAGAEGGTELIHGEFDPKRVLMAGAMGAALPNANNLGSKVLATGEAVGARYRGGNTNPDLKPAAHPDQPDIKPDIPAPQEDEITVANDITTTARGVAMENPPAPEIVGAGNPVGAPMVAREGARPSDPARNYEKGQTENQPALSDNKIIDTDPLKSDISAALESRPPEEGQAPDGAQGTATQGTDVLPREAAPPIQPEQDMHTPQVKAQAQIPESLGPEETSRAQRERVADVQKRMAESQLGEDFHDVEPARPGAGAGEQQAPKAPEALTPEEMKSLAEDRKTLAQAGWDRALQALDKVAPRQQLDTLSQYANEARKELATKAGQKPAEAEARRPTGELRKESRYKNSLGFLAASQKELDYHEQGIKLRKDLYQDYGPQSEKGKALDVTDPDKKAEIKDFAKQVWADAVHRNGGRDPLNRSETYTPAQKGHGLTTELEWLRAVRDAKNGSLKRLALVQSTEGQMADLTAETGRVEGDIMRRPQLEETSGEAETAAGAMEQSRTTFEHMNPDPRPGADNSYVEDHNKLADWLNDRSPAEYEKLAGKYDLRAEMDEPADPAELMNDMKQSLVDTGRRPKGEISSEVELPPKPVKAAVLPSKEEATPVGRVLDKNSEEFKRLAAQYNEQAPAGPAKTKSEQLQDLSAKERSAAEAINGATHEAVIDKVKQFVGDESGAGYLHRMFSQPANPSSPAAAPGVTDYADTLSTKFRDRTAETKNLKVEIMANLAAAADAKLTPHEHRQISLAEQDNNIGSLPQKLRDFYSEHVSPVRNRAMQVMRDFKDLNDTEKLGYDLPNLNAVTTKAYQPRYQIDKQAMNRKANEAFDPFTGHGMGDYSPNLEDRKFFALENGPKRMVVEVTGDKDNGFGLNIHRAKGNVQVLKNIPASFEGKLGDTLDLNVKGQKGKWTLDQGTTKEIENATGIKYYENAAWNWSRMLDDMSRAYENAKLTSEIKNDPEFQKLTTTDKDVAEKNGWSKKVSTHLPEFATRNGKPLYMPDNMRWVFDDYHKPGFGGITSEGIEKLRNFNVGLLKVFNTNAPLVHVLNELDLFTVGRGFKWISPKAYYDLAVSAPKAFKSVNSQDHIQAEMRRVGVNPMLASVGIRSMYETAAKNMGMEIIKDHSAWDPLARAYGVSTKEVGQKLYDVSSDVTWRLSDYLTTMRYLEEKANGHSPEEAAKRVNKFMSDYHIGTTVLGSRALQQLLTEPGVTAFGRYKAGIFRSLGHMTRDLLSPQATKQDRIDALGQWLVMGALGYVVYPAADALVQKLTGNEGGELRRRGVTSVADAAKNIVTGEKDPTAMLTRAWTPAPLTNAALELSKNRDFAGKPIVPQGEWPGVIPDAAANVAEYGLKTAVPPYGTMSQYASRKEGTAAGALGGLAADQLGVALPSEASQKRESRIEKVNAMAEKARHNRPSGVIPALMNRLTE